MLIFHFLKSQFHELFNLPVLSSLVELVRPHSPVQRDVAFLSANRMIFQFTIPSFRSITKICSFPNDPFQSAFLQSFFKL